MTVWRVQSLFHQYFDTFRIRLNEIKSVLVIFSPLEMPHLHSARPGRMPLAPFPAANAIDCQVPNPTLQSPVVTAE